MTAANMPAEQAGAPQSARQGSWQQAGVECLSIMLSDAFGALMAWRDRRRALAHLRRMSDMQLRDLGITRLEIERVVRTGRR